MRPLVFSLGWALAQAGAQDRGPGTAYTGICLGNCYECQELLDSLPRWPRMAAASSHMDPGRSNVEDIEAFLRAPEVCEVGELFPISFDREIWSLATLRGGPSRLRHPSARSQVKQSVAQCTALQSMSVDLFLEARRAASACAAGGAGDGGKRCRQEATKHALRTLSSKFLVAFGSPTALSKEASLEENLVVEIDFGTTKNETGDLLQAFSKRTELLFRHYEASEDLHASLASLPLSESAAAALLGLSFEMARLARSLMEFSRTVWGIRDLLVEISSVYPTIHEQLPVFKLHATRYGRHWDVLEWLMHGQVAGEGKVVTQEDALSEAPFNMVELGVACGPIGYHLLPRFPSLRYFGGDPTVPQAVREGYQQYADRATVFANTSEELNQILPQTELVDFAFIDGPHTYANVRTDLELWSPRMRPGGIIAGHDFTCAHPPLLWAVIEFRTQMGGGDVNVGMDGVWWWRA
mmetsp:Transcript_82373/g.181188  ORF Transcript_82373/g.181188 Transcript_82373/m.181188 type:complete len:467 (-) Transcript_82373:315-1715(-)